jgi:ornithine cyclodeaminase
MMAANYLTDIRTAAVSAVATKLMSRPDASALGVFGTGRQALAHILVLSWVRKFERILVCGSSLSRSEEFARHLWGTHKVKVEAVDSATCASASNVICTCTTSRTPLFDGREVRDGTHLNLVGGFQPDTREVDSYLMRRARIVVDTYEGALAEAGELLIPLMNGELARECISADLHEIASGKKKPRSSPQEVTVFKSVGCAFQDLVIGKLVWDQLSKSSPGSS